MRAQDDWRLRGGPDQIRAADLFQLKERRAELSLHVRWQGSRPHFNYL